jgi:hypothetical protein
MQSQPNLFRTQSQSLIPPRRQLDQGDLSFEILSKQQTCPDDATIVTDEQ